MLCIFIIYSCVMAEMCRNRDLEMIIFLIEELHKMVMEEADKGHTNNIQFTSWEWECLANKVNEKKFKCAKVQFTSDTIRAKVQRMKNGRCKLMSLMETHAMPSKLSLWSDILLYTDRRSVAPSAARYFSLRSPQYPETSRHKPSSSRHFSPRPPQYSETSNMHQSTSQTKRRKASAPKVTDPPESNTVELNNPPSFDAEVYSKTVEALDEMKLPQKKFGKCIKLLNLARDEYWMHLFLCLPKRHRSVFLDRALKKYDLL